MRYFEVFFGKRGRERRLDSRPQSLFWDWRSRGLANWAGDLAAECTIAVNPSQRTEGTLSPPYSQRCPAPHSDGWMVETSEEEGKQNEDNVEVIERLVEVLANGKQGRDD